MPIDLNDCIIKRVGTEKPRNDRFYKTYCNSCGADRGYLLKAQGERPTCNKCSGIGRHRVDVASKRQLFKNVNYSDWTVDASGIRKFAAACVSCQKKRYVREMQYNKECRSCTNRRLKQGKPSKSRAEAGLPPMSRTQVLLKKRTSDGVRRALKRRSTSKSEMPVLELLHYSIEELERHLESQFQLGMSWNNYGRGGWHIDHVIPDSWFEYTSTEDEGFRKSWSLSNLQPLWEKDNCSKSNRYSGVVK